MHGRKTFVVSLVVATFAAGAAPAHADGPYEPNNDAGSATSLPVTGVVSAALETENDRDVFSFYARGERQVTVQLTSPRAPMCGVYLNGEGDGLKYSAFGLMIDEYTPAASRAHTISPEAGRYTVTVDAGCADAPYTFSVSPADAISPRPVPTRACLSARNRTSAARALVKQRTTRAKTASKPAKKRAARRALDRAKQRLRAAKATEATACRVES